MDAQSIASLPPNAVFFTIVRVRDRYINLPASPKFPSLTAAVIPQATPENNGKAQVFFRPGLLVFWSFFSRVALSSIWSIIGSRHDFPHSIDQAKAGEI